MIVGSIHVQSSVNNRQQHCISHCHYSLHQVQITGIFVRTKEKKENNVIDRKLSTLHTHSSPTIHIHVTCQCCEFKYVCSSFNFLLMECQKKK